MPTAPKQHRPPGHRPPSTARPADRYRGTSAERGYDNKTWAPVRDYVRERDNYLCQRCLTANRLTPCGTPGKGNGVVDHKIPVHVRPDLRLDETNLQLLCLPCHRVKTAEDNRLYGSREARHLTPSQASNRQRAQQMTVTTSYRRVVVCGPPGSGKTTYVEQHRQPGDLTWDYDYIAAALMGGNLYSAPASMIHLMEQMQRGFINHLRDNPHYGNVWVIASAKERAARIATEIKAEVVTLDTPTEECLRRLSRDPQRAARMDEYQASIERWHESKVQP